MPVASLQHVDSLARVFGQRVCQAARRQILDHLPPKHDTGPWES